MDARAAHEGWEHRDSQREVRAPLGAKLPILSRPDHQAALPWSNTCRCACVCVRRRNTLVSLCGLSSTRHVPRLGEEPRCRSPSPTKDSVCGQKTSRAPWQLCCSPENFSWQQWGRPDSGSLEGSGTARTCLAGSPRPARRAGASAGKGAAPTVLARHPAESCKTKHGHSISGQLWGP